MNPRYFLLFLFIEILENVKLREFSQKPITRGMKTQKYPSRRIYYYVDDCYRETLGEKNTK